MRVERLILSLRRTNLLKVYDSLLPCLIVEKLIYCFFRKKFQKNSSDFVRYKLEKATATPIMMPIRPSCSNVFDYIASREGNFAFGMNQVQKNKQTNKHTQPNQTKKQKKTIAPNKYSLLNFVNDLLVVGVSIPRY